MNGTGSHDRLAVGVMTGTSIDGIDAALVRIRGEGLSMRAELVGYRSQPLGNIGTRLRAAAEQQPMTAGDFAQLAWEFGELHAGAVGELLGSPQQEHPLHLICVHGQTVFHHPPISWQLINPAPIARRFGCPIIFDLRQADLASGGQGAPITPMADWVLFRDSAARRAVVNLGGFCNVTILPRCQSGGEATELNGIRGFDVCACNQVLDAVARAALKTPFDQDGKAASRGCAKPEAAETLLRILTKQREGARSLGTGDEAIEWVRAQQRAGTSGEDLAASAVAAIARCIATAVRENEVDEIIVAGGGARNLALFESIGHEGKAPVRRSDELGVPIVAREAMAFALLGALSQDGVAITLPQVTGCAAPAPRSGCRTPAFAD